MNFIQRRLSIYLYTKPTSKMAGSLATMILRASHPPTTMKMLSGDASNATPANARIFSLEVDGVDIMIGDGSAEPWKGPSSPPRRRGQQRRSLPVYVEPKFSSLIPMLTTFQSLSSLSSSSPRCPCRLTTTRPPVARPNITTILNFFSILFRCDMTKIG